MSIKQELQAWVDALAHYDRNDFQRAFEAFQVIADTSKIFFNCGVIHATLGRHIAAIDYYKRATSLDQYFAVAYFQQGVSNFLLGDFEEALANFNDALLYLRGNDQINYEQIGLNFTLFSCEVMFNRGLCYIYLQQRAPGMQDLKYAAKEKKKLAHDVIDDAIKDKAEGYTVFSIPVGVVFRPHEAKVRNIIARDYLGKATLVATTVPDPNAASSRRRASVHGWARNSGPSDGVSYAASNLVKPELLSSSRQHSEPPLSRRAYLESPASFEQPPTPPPKPQSQQVTPQSIDRADRAQARSQSVPRRPEPLTLEPSSIGRPAPRSHSLERPSLTRAVSDQLPGTSQNTPDHHSFSLSLRTKKSRPLLGLQTESLDLPASEDLPSISANSSIRRHFKQRPDSIEEEDEGMVSIMSAIDAPASAAPASAAPPRDHLRSTSHTRKPSFSSFPFARSRHASLDRSHSASRSAQAVATASSPAPAVTRTIRLKVHYNDDTRYIIAQISITFVELVISIAKKFKLHSSMNLVVKARDDDGDLITIADQEDLEAACLVCAEVAAKESSEYLRLEVWISEKNT